MKPPRPTPAGVALLRAYIEKTDRTVYSFAKRTGLVCDHILKVLRGDRRRISVDLALDIQTATGGEVPVSAWRMRPPSPPLLDVRLMRPSCEMATG